MSACTHACCLLYKHQSHQHPNYLITITSPPLADKNNCFPKRVFTLLFKCKYFYCIQQYRYSYFVMSGLIFETFSCLGKALSCRTTSNQDYPGKDSVLNIVSLHTRHSIYMSAQMECNLYESLEGGVI